MAGEVKSLQDYVNELSATVQAIKEEIDIIASGGFMPAGSVYFADLPALIDERYGFVYNIKDAFVTTSDFIEGPGKSYSAGTNVGIVRDEERELKYDVLASFVDTAAIFGAIELKQSMRLSKEIAGADTVEGALESLDNNIGITIDDELSTTSTNPVQNKVIKSALDAKANTDGKIAEAYSADYAAKAANDAHNNNIANTYATKDELTNGLNNVVEANPQGESVGTLNSIGIKGRKYNIEGQGGTDVEGNPSGEPTDNLDSIRIGQTIYNVQGGGETPIVNNETLIFS